MNSNTQRWVNEFAAKNVAELKYVLSCSGKSVHYAARSGNPKNRWCAEVMFCTGVSFARCGNGFHPA